MTGLLLTCAMVQDGRSNENLDIEVTIGLVKYVELHDAYLSVVEALSHGGLPHSADVKIKWIHSENLDDTSVDDYLKT